jgi:predicted RNA-binding Zn-ribbon protein involved in translation (DUF1610 family)
MAHQRVRCPTCGLVLAPRAPEIVWYCPRCLARRRVLVELELELWEDEK